MNGLSLKRLIQDTDLPSFALSFFMGQASYFLKLVSIVKILEHLSLQSFPVLMLCQAFISYNFLKLCESIQKKSHTIFHFFISSICVAVVVLANHPMVNQLTLESYGWIISCLFFFASMNLVDGLDLSVGSIIAHKTSVLKNPNISTKLTLSQELGILTSAALVYVTANFQTIPFSYLIPGIPFMLILVTTMLINAHLKSEIQVKQTAHDDKLQEFNKYNFPFVSLIISLMTLMLVIKNLQSFAVLVGINELSSTTSSSVTSLFSQISLIETSLIMFVLFLNMGIAKKNETWSKGFKVFFSVQSFSLFSLFASMNPFLLIATGIGRKIIQHTVMDSSQRLLLFTLPSRVALQARSYIKKNVGIAYYIIVAALTSLAIYKLIPFHFLWLIGGLLSLGGFYLRKKLFNTLTEFQVANILRSNIYDAVNACYSLSNPEARGHSSALISLLKNQPRPFIAKAVIRALGEISNPKAIPVLIEYYHLSKREDIQLAVIQALLKFESHEIDLFLVKTLENIIREQVSLGQIRRSIFKAITSRISHIAIPYLLTILKEKENDFRVIANAIIVIGEIAEKNNDEELYEKLSQFLDSKYSRRVRTNAIMFLFKSKHYRLHALECFQSFLASTDPHDRAAIAFVAGELQLKSMLPYVLETSLANNHQNSTLLISLLKQDYPDSYKLVADFILNAKTEEDRAMAINQLSAISKMVTRYRVYHQVLIHYPERINELLDYLRLSQRDFDQDRQVIQNEAARLGLDIFQDTSIFIKSAENEKKVA